mgnify:CR=1 FL=1
MAEAHARTFCTEKEDSKMQKMMIHYNDVPIYPIVLSENFDALGEALDDLMIKDRKVCIVTDSHVADFYLEQVEHIVKEHCAAASHFIFPAGEESKTLTTVENLYEFLIQNKFERKDMLVALGGGVVGDLTGFTAATYLRGIRFIQIPTSLLAQVDSSIGGKTGVDFRAYKNMVGAFHQPKLVYSCAETLKTLTSQQYISGLGEIIKHGLIKDAVYYEWIKENIDAIKAREHEAVKEMIYQSCLIKGGVVERDPKEKGERALLNFGHTLGHAIEKLKDFTWLHGECVAAGCCLAAEISCIKGNINKEEVEDIKGVFEAFDMNGDIDELSVDDIVKTTKSDKKMVGDKIKFVLLRSVGDAYIDMSVTDDEMKQVLQG